MANKVTRIVNANGTISFNNSISLSNSNTANYITQMLNNNSTSGIHVAPSLSTNTKIHSWPKRHSHRCGVYHYNIKKFTKDLLELNMI